MHTVYLCTSYCIQHYSINYTRIITRTTKVPEKTIQKAPYQAIVEKTPWQLPVRVFYYFGMNNTRIVTTKPIRWTQCKPRHWLPGRESHTDSLFVPYLSEISKQTRTVRREPGVENGVRGPPPGTVRQMFGKHK